MLECDLEPPPISALSRKKTKNTRFFTDQDTQPAPAPCIFVSLLAGFKLCGIRAVSGPTIRSLRRKVLRVNESKHTGDDAGHFRTNTPCGLAEHQFAVDATITVAHQIAPGDTA
jgi:hypothetical protein